MSELPPPYLPHPPSSPSAPGFPSAFSTQPSAFPGSPYQTFPQTYTGGGDQSYYQGPPMFPPGAYLTPPISHGYQSGQQQHHLKTHGEPPKHPVFVVEQNRHGDHDGGGTGNSCLAACSAALCCCCLWDMITHNLC